jgi:hypothetical protein
MLAVEKEKARNGGTTGSTLIIKTDAKHVVIASFLKII